MLIIVEDLCNGLIVASFIPLLSALTTGETMERYNDKNDKDIARRKAAMRQSRKMIFSIVSSLNRYHR